MSYYLVLNLTISFCAGVFFFVTANQSFTNKHLFQITGIALLVNTLFEVAAFFNYGLTSAFPNGTLLSKTFIISSVFNCTLYSFGLFVARKILGRKLKEAKSQYSDPTTLDS